MNTDLHHIITTRTARFYTIGKIDSNTKIVYFALHGYGQQASRFIKKFNHLDDVFVIAPEALSRFYWDQKSGQTAASWMTKDDREFEIADYCNYLQSVFELYISKIPVEVKICLLGFSQGGATAIRWLLLKKPERIDFVQLWGSDIPLDMNYQDSNDYLLSKKILWVYGNSDPYLNSEKIRLLEDKFIELKLQVEINSFDGGHEIDRTMLHQLQTKLVK